MFVFFQYRDYPLHLACWKGRLDLVQQFLENQNSHPQTHPEVSSDNPNRSFSFHINLILTDYCISQDGSALDVLLKRSCSSECEGWREMITALRAVGVKATFEPDYLKVKQKLLREY